MAKDTLNNVKLGLFISVALVIVIISLYLIGRNQNFFGSNFYVRARFANINGLITGNNVRFSGIQVGVVDKIKVIDDTTVEVVLVIDKNMQPYIHQNSIAAIGNDGLMGNKVINITPNKLSSPVIVEGGLLYTRKAPYTDEMMEKLSSTNNNVEVLSFKLVNTVDQLNNSKALWRILNDTTIPVNLKVSINNIKEASVKINELTDVIHDIARDLHEGKGTAGMLLTDEKAAADIKQAIENIDKASKESVTAIAAIDSVVQQLHQDMFYGKGAIHTMLRDTQFVSRLNNSMVNIEKGTAAFSQDMEALKHNVLTRGYFKKEAKKLKETKKP